MPARRVIKLGGSLLEWRELPERFEGWLRRQAPARNCLIAGGGAAVDRLRRAQAQEGWDDVTAHWRAIDALSVTARQVRGILAPVQLELHVLRAPDTMFAADEATLRIVDGAWFLRHQEPNARPPRLPRSWDVTSDSIAARLAQLGAADELVLLKSASPRAASWQGMADQGYVDRFFPRLVPHLPAVRWVNLRAARTA